MAALAAMLVGIEARHAALFLGIPTGLAGRRESVKYAAAQVIAPEPAQAPERRDLDSPWILDTYVHGLLNEAFPASPETNLAVMIQVMQRTLRAAGIPDIEVGPSRSMWAGEMRLSRLKWRIEYNQEFAKLLAEGSRAAMVTFAERLYHQARIAQRTFDVARRLAVQTLSMWRLGYRAEIAHPVVLRAAMANPLRDTDPKAGEADRLYATGWGIAAWIKNRAIERELKNAIIDEAQFLTKHRADIYYNDRLRYQAETRAMRRDSALAAYYAAPLEADAQAAEDLLHQRLLDSGVVGPVSR